MGAENQVVGEKEDVASGEGSQVIGEVGIMHAGFGENCRVEILTKEVVTAKDIGKDLEPETEENIDKMTLQKLEGQEKNADRTTYVEIITDENFDDKKSSNLKTEEAANTILKSQEAVNNMTAKAKEEQVVSDCLTCNAEEGKEQAERLLGVEEEQVGNIENIEANEKLQVE